MNSAHSARAPRLDEIVERIYASALDPECWREVMALMKRRFRSSGEAFYFLDFEPRRVRAVHLGGIPDGWYRRFDELYFTADNPWVRFTKILHRPGVIRTNERLAEFARDAGVLYRSTYYNEWMRPQAFRHTIGNTMLSEQGTVANLTLLRPSDMPPFTAAEVRAFERLSVHFTRALNVAMRLERAAQLRERSASVFDELVHGVVTLDAAGRLLHANRSAAALVDAGRGLTVRDGVLVAHHPADRRRLEALLRSVLPGETGAGRGRGATIEIRADRGGPHGDRGERLVVSAMPVAPAPASYFSTRGAVLLTIADPAQAVTSDAHAMRERWRMTPAEARLASALAEGASLKQAAERLGVTYGTARGYLKLLFQKTETHTQAQLVGRLLRDAVARA